MSIIVFDGGASGGGATSRKPNVFGNRYREAVETQILFSEEMNNSNICGSSDFNFYVKDRLPSHVQELYDKFTRFVGLFYKFLECEQSLGNLTSFKDLDESPDNLFKLFKNTYAAGLPDKTFKLEDGESIPIINFDDPTLSNINVRNFLRFVKEFYQMKSTEEAYDFFFRTFYSASVAIDYPKKLVHMCSEGAYLGSSAGYRGPSGASTPCDALNAAGNVAAPGSVCGVYYGNEKGLLSGFSRIHDNKYYQNFSYFIDAEINWDSYKDYVRNILHPAGLFVAGNYILTDTFQQPGTTGTTVPIEIPIIGNYTPYRFSTSVNLRDNVNGVDLYPCGYNPYVAGQGVSYTSQHFQDSGGLWYKNEGGATAHQTGLSPLGVCGGTGGLDAALIGLEGGFRIFHHPNTWTTTVPFNSEMKDISIGGFLFLSPINTNVGSPNNANESLSGCK
jgi:hypothetical protein